MLRICDLGRTLAASCLLAGVLILLCVAPTRLAAQTTTTQTTSSGSTDGGSSGPPPVDEWDDDDVSLVAVPDMDGLKSSAQVLTNEELDPSSWLDSWLGAVRTLVAGPCLWMELPICAAEPERSPVGRRR